MIKLHRMPVLLPLVTIAALVWGAATAQAHFICRTPGFWGTHAGVEKPGSQNITQTVISLGGGALPVCGGMITNTDLDNTMSAEEAICVAPRGVQRLQLIRQLTALSLNCVTSGFWNDCSVTGGAPEGLAGLYGQCNTLCADGSASNEDLSYCIAAVDCTNNGGAFDPATGACLVTPGNCAEQPLEDVASVGISFEPPGPAGSSEKCNDANGNTCTVFGGC